MGVKEIEIEIHEWELAVKKTLQKIVTCSLGGDLVSSFATSTVV